MFNKKEYQEKWNQINKQYHKKRYIKNRKNICLQHKQYYQINREKINKKHSNYRKLNPNYMKEYYQKNKNKARKYYKIHRKDIRKKILEYRHNTGINKRYRYEIKGMPSKFHKQRYMARKRNAGDLPLKRIQLVYKNNIKKYGTLTCYLCLDIIDFKKDCLEHKLSPLKGGTNEYKNLAIAHRICNNKKYNKTEKEYRKELKLHARK